MEKVKGILGLCQKAGRLQSGDFSAEKAIKSGKARLLLIEESASENTQKKYTELCSFRGIPLIRLKEVGSPIGKTGRLVAAVTDENFARMIRNACAAGEKTGE